MSIFKEVPPTAGFPLYLKDFLALFKSKSLEEDLKTYIGLEYASVTYSGTAALYFILETLKDFSSKTSVIIPSYVCPLVPLAVKRAGFKIEVCDISLDSFDFDLQELDNLCSYNHDILAVIPVHLAGIPVDFTPMEKIVRRHGIFIIEDCAQSLGAVYKGKKTGTLGDFSFFSLCRGKGLTIYEGGVAATTKKEYAQILDKKINLLAKDDFISENLKVWELLGYWVFYRPSLFWFVFNLPQVFWNLSGNKLKALNEYFSVNFPIYRVSPIRKSIGHSQFERLEQEIVKQREKASFYLNALKEVKGIKAMQELSDTIATYPYLTLIFDTPKRRNQTWQALKDLGLGVSQIYAYAIGEYDYLRPIIPHRDYPRGRYLAQREITLSTSTFLDKEDLTFIVRLIKNL